MNTFKDGLSLISEQNKIIQAAKNEIDRIEQQMIKLFCPVSVGDVVVVNRYSYEGKNMQVEGVRMSRGWEGNGFIAWGRVLKKDGTAGANRAEYFCDPLPNARDV